MSQPDNLANELRQKTDRRDELVARQGKVGPEKLVGRELEQALLDPQIPIVQDFVAQVTAHRGTLTGLGCKLRINSANPQEAEPPKCRLGLPWWHFGGSASYSVSKGNSLVRLDLPGRKR
ncbi:hypothetical protein [Hymenobacter terrenus]|uniref:hypothetical protein n=1 Tax=Hymenobacter terrenus TaxID=1629124 RepID=UPI000619BAE3|nr:hypothetical protein [Hymenobacter terrenus]